jgi:hypothetical protein
MPQKFPVHQNVASHERIYVVEQGTLLQSFFQVSSNVYCTIDCFIPLFHLSISSIDSFGLAIRYDEHHGLARPAHLRAPPT